jgi:hypothetical protein
MAYVHEHEVDEAHHHTDSGSNAMGWVIGLILVLVVLWLLFVYGLPAIRSAATPQVAIPERVDVNVNTPQQGGGNQ